ncbi:MAG: response regulator [bacterium]
MGKARILLVDDESDILDILSEFLDEEGYDVKTAGDGIAALEILEQEQFNLLLSDINMPRMKGFELIAKAKRLYPELKHALFTAYDVNSYIKLAKEHNIGNIITKSSPFNFVEFGIFISNIISGKIFGIDKFFNPEIKISEFTVTNSSDMEEVIEKLFNLLGGLENPKRIKTVLRELITNAVYYGALNRYGDRKDEWEIDFKLDKNNFIKTCFARDNEKTAISIIDNKGGLEKKDILYWLERNILRNKDGIAVNIYDEHGRGLFISREFIDRMIINLNPGIRTEIILLCYFSALSGSKPLIINEL